MPLIDLETCPQCCGTGWMSHPDDPAGHCTLCRGTGGIPATTQEIVVVLPSPCRCCGRAWERVGPMEFELRCGCPSYIPAVKESPLPIETRAWLAMESAPRDGAPVLGRPARPEITNWTGEMWVMRYCQHSGVMLREGPGDWYVTVFGRNTCVSALAWRPL